MEEVRGSVSKKSVLGVPTEDVRAVYELGKELGKGQFGVTRLCTHKASGKSFACKTISKRRFTCKEDADDVRTEVHVLRTLSGTSPNIIRFEDAFEDPRSVHLVMQFCSGGELFDRIISRGSYSELAASSACSTIVQVLRTCHSHGVMHRDLKPENFLLLDPSDDAPLVAIDFGLSTFFQPGIALLSRTLHPSLLLMMRNIREG
jgi:calcium-dependent protein kinase